MSLSISVLIPVYNSEDSLEELYSRIKKVLENSGADFEVIMVDDYSTDSSYQIMRSLRSRDDRVRIIRLAANVGQHNATFCGLHYCKADYIVTLDDDLQNPPEEIPRLIAKITEGYDVVFGVPRQKQHSIFRNWGSAIINSCLSMIYHKPRNIRSSSYRILRKSVVEKMLSRPRYDIFMAALIMENTSNIGNLPVKHDKRKYGKTNYSLKKSLKLTGQLLIDYSYLPIKIMAVFWLSFFVLAILFALILWIYAPCNGKIFQRLMAVFILFISGLNTISFFLLTKYIQSFAKEPAVQELYEIAEIEI